MTGEDASALYLRGYDELTHHNLVLRAGPAAAAGTLAFRVRSDARPVAGGGVLRGARLPAERLPAGAVRGLGEEVRVEDPLGFLVDFFAVGGAPERLQQRYDLRRGAEVARLDHFNICVPDVPRALRVLGARVRAVGDDRGRPDAVRGLDVPQADGARRGVHRRGRAAPAPPGFLRARAAQRAADVRHPRLDRH